MPYKPRFTITSAILRRLETLQALYARIQDASVQLSALPSFQNDMVVRSAHGSSAIEGNPLTLEEARTVVEGKDVPRASRRSIQEIRNAASAMRYIQRHSEAKAIREAHIFRIHSILGAEKALDRGPIGAYRDYGVQVGGHIAPHASDVPHFIQELLEWLKNESIQWPAVVSSAILHFRFEFIHPFGDGNGRTGRALAAWELYRRKFDSRHIFAVDEVLWDHRPKYYAALASVQKDIHHDLTGWIEFMVEMIDITLDRTWKRIEAARVGEPYRRLHLTSRQEKLLKLLRAGPMRPTELVRELGLTKGGLHYLLKALLEAKLVQRDGGYKTGVYRIPPLQAVRGLAKGLKPGPLREK